MTANLTLIAVAGTLFGCGVVLLMAKSLVRALLGILLMGNGVNILFLVASGPAGRAPIVDKESAKTTVIGPEGISDPLPQALVLTAIVITLAVTAFCMALAHRAWAVSASDNVEDDIEDARIHELAESDVVPDTDYRDTRDPHALADSGASDDEGEDR